MDSSCMEALFITVDGYLTLLHSLGKKLLMDIATDREYRAAFEREEAFWLQQLIDVLTHCKICGYLLPGVDRSIVLIQTVSLSGKRKLAPLHPSLYGILF